MLVAAVWSLLALAAGWTAAEIHVGAVVSSEGQPQAIDLGARRGRLFVHQLHSGTYFERTEPVNWSATALDRPDLPKWLNLAQSPYSAIAFLYGTPELNDSTENILVLAKSQKTFEISRKILRIHIRQDISDDNHSEEAESVSLANTDLYSSEDTLNGVAVTQFESPPLAKGRFTIPLLQVAELWLRNYDAWELLSDPKLMEELQSRVRRAFRGLGIRPYIRDLKPASAAGGRVPLTKEKVGVVLYVGTRKGFPEGVQLLAKGLQNNPEQCHRKEIIPLDKHFGPQFIMDWCKFRLFNVSGADGSDPEYESILHDRAGLNLDQSAFARGLTTVPYGVARGSFTAYSRSGLIRDYFWDWVSVLVIPGAVIIVIMLIMCLIFFGAREGQHWRDYKTPDGQLQEYLSLRRSQQKLRELSNQRQSLVLLDEAPKGTREISTALTGSLYANEGALYRQTLSRDGTVLRSTPGRTRSSRSPSRPTMEMSPGPVGKQTVAEAATARGSSIDLYREFHDKETAEIESDEDTVIDAETLNAEQSKEGGGAEGQTSAPAAKSTNTNV